MKILSLLFCFLSMSFLNGAYMNQIEGSGIIKTETRNLPPFQELRIVGKALVFLQQGDESEISIEGDDNIVPLITTDIENKMLSISPLNNYSIDPKVPLIYKITTPQIDFIQLTGSSDLKSDGELHSEFFRVNITGSATCDLTLYTTDLHVEISGSGKLTANGSTQKENIIISGSGQFLGNHMKSSESHIRIAGSAIAKVNALDILNIVITGNGIIYYSGDPKVYKKITGNGSLIKEVEDHKS
ncbi:MAG: DUF2807 domain-containing protein [Rhabdochlamydiaceae bacterium]|nr:DUF2807 domain-containing protein [Candidatus Amphrikana amoebophyrae]